MNKNIQNEIEDYLRSMTHLGKFSGAVLITHLEEIIHSSGYGLANREHEVVNTPHTKFRIGSITKQFTSTAVMILGERGKLNVHDHIDKYLPYALPQWNEITIHHLLNHTSGIMNLTNIPGCLETTARLSLSVEELVDIFKEMPLDFSPGSNYCYSNSGYLLLGDIIERVADTSYEQFIKDHIFNPLEMNDSGYDHHNSILANRAQGYSMLDGKWIQADYIDMSFPFAAGALYSTVEDLYRWNQALLANRLISQSSYTQMTTASPLSNYGYGFIIGLKHNRRVISHTGGINGFCANLVCFPDEPACVVVLSNSEVSDFLEVTKVINTLFLS